VSVITRSRYRGPLALVPGFVRRLSAPVRITTTSGRSAG